MDLRQFLPKEGDTWSLTSENYDDLLQLLQKLSKATVDPNYRSSLDGEVLRDVESIFLNAPNTNVCVECVKILRNCAAGELKDGIKISISAIEKALSHVERALQNGKKLDENELMLVRVSLQFFANLINSEPEASLQIWTGMQKLFENVLIHEDEKIGLFSSSVLYGILRNSAAVREEIISDQWKETAHSIVHSSHRGHVFSQFSVQLYVKENGLLPRLYNNLTLDSKLLLLHQVAEFSPECTVEKGNWQFFASIFQERATVILRTRESTSVDLEALEIAGILEVIAKASGTDKICREELQRNHQLISASIDLLKAIWSIGQSGSNYFTTEKDHFAAKEVHPAFNFKGNLIRLLGNLSYQNTAVQDLIRESDAIAPILECCNLDARNPFIQQWSILAIRNMCEKNVSNQELIASLTYKGVLQPNILEDLGMVIEKTSGGMIIRTEDSKN